MPFAQVVAVRVAVGGEVVEPYERATVLIGESGNRWGGAPGA